MQCSIIQQLIKHFISAFQQLKVQVSLREIESLATTVHKSMTVHTRSYHTPDHVLHLSDCSAPIQSLAAMYHDIVYYQVDRGLSTDVAKLIAPYITEQHGEVQVREGIDERDVLLMLTLEVFGLSPGQKLSPFNGQNEFLSALFMNRTLGAILPLKTLVSITAHIEATIPFRGTTGGSPPWTLVLRKRLETLPPKCQMSFSLEELDETVCSAVQFANRDVDSFGEPDIGTFLSGTWNLLPEDNSSLRSERVYSIRDYRKALQKMEGFLTHLSPDNIFHRYQNTPPREEYRQLQNTARRNVTVAREYLGIKLLAIGIIEALAELTGGDAPLLLFMGDLRHKEHAPTAHIESSLTVKDNKSAAALNPPVSSLLEDGRPWESSFDIKRSPTAFFIYQRLAPKTIQQLLTRAKDMFRGEISAQDFLESIEQSLVAGIASACAEMAITRREELLRYTRATGSV